MHRMFTGPGHKVDRALTEGDEVAGFAVLDTPGHSAGHMSLWRESDRTLILGDVLNSHGPAAGHPRAARAEGLLHARTRRATASRPSASGELEPLLVLFGHGPPVRDTRKFVDFCAAL